MKGLLKRFFGVENNSITEKEQIVPNVSKPRWREENGIIYISVISEGKKGYELSDVFETRRRNDSPAGKVRLTPTAEYVLSCSGFEPTNGVITEIAIIKNLKHYNCHSFVNVSTVLHEAKENSHLTEMSLESIWLLMQKLTISDLKKMGLNRIEFMHELHTSEGEPFNLTLTCMGEIIMRSHYLTGPGGGGFFEKEKGNGFAFCFQN